MTIDRRGPGGLAYNLIRQSMGQSTIVKQCRPRSLSFTATLQMLANQWVLAAGLTGPSQKRTGLIAGVQGDKDGL